VPVAQVRETLLNAGAGERCYVTAASLGAAGLRQVKMVFRSPARFGTELNDSFILACCPLGGLRVDGVGIAFLQQDRSVVHVQFESSLQHRVALRRP